MKKYLSIFLVSLFLLFPFVIKAEGEETEPGNEVVELYGVYINDYEVKLNVGEDHTLNVDFYPIDYTENVIYKSSDETIATVSNTGVIHAVAAGKATISVTGEVSGETDSIEISVYNPITDIEVTGIPEKGMAVYGSYILTAEIVPGNTKETEVVWDIDSDEAYVSSGGTCYVNDKEVELKDNQACVRLHEEGDYKLQVSVYNTDFKKTIDLKAVKMVTDVYVVFPATNYNLVNDSLVGAIIYLSEGKTMQLEVNGYPSDAPQVYTYSVTDESIATVDDKGLVTALKAGVVTVTVTATETGANYSVEVTIKDKAPTLKKFTKFETASYDANSAFVAWYPVDGAAKYNIYRATSKKGKYKLVQTTTNYYYEDTKLKCGSTYYYKIQAVNSSEKVTSKILKVKIKPDTVNYAYPETVTDKKVKLEWYKLNVTGYEVYRSTKKNKGFKKVATIKKAATITYTDKKLKPNTKYYYKFRTYKTVKGKKIYSSYTKNPIEITTAPAVPKVTITPDSISSLKINIPASKGAVRYEIYRGTDKNDVNNYVMSLDTAGAYVDDYLNFGTTYYYKVNACNSDWNCSTTSIISAKVTTKVPTLTLTKEGKGKVNVSVGTVADATGYEVYKSTKEKKGYKLLNTVSETERTFLDSGKSKKTYYYKVRSYREVDGTKVYSPYSKVVKVKVK